MSREIRVTRPPARTEPIELYPDFDETLTTNVEDTVRNLRILPERERSTPESQRWQFKAVADLTEEVKALRHELGNVVRALDKKTSISAQGKFEKAMGERITARLDTMRTTAMWAVGLLFLVVIGIVKVGHG